MENKSEIKKKKIYLISSAHFFTDVYSSFLEPILPLLMAKFSIGILYASILGSVMAVSRDVTQPIFGYFSDKLKKPVFIIFGLLFIGIFMPLLGIAPTYIIALIFVLNAGLGFASFHPQGAAAVSLYSGENNRDRGMAYFIVSGRLGHSVGPGMVVILLSIWGLPGLIPAVLPAIIISFLIFKYIKIEDIAPKIKLSVRNAFKEKKLQMSLLLFIASLRAFIILSFTTFIPMFITEKGGTVNFGGVTLFLMHFAGTIGVYLGGGYLVKKIGSKSVLVISFVLSVPFLFSYVFLEGIQSVIAICIGDLILCLSIPIAISIAQRMVSSHIGTVTSLMMGFAWGVGGFFLSAAGAFAENFGLDITLKIIAVSAVLGGITSFFIKDIKEE